jgi:hypothetical protein
VHFQFVDPVFQPGRSRKETRLFAKFALLADRHETGEEAGHLDAPLPHR